jgi:hypothetical protein
MSAALQEATIQQQCKQLHLPAVAGQCVRLAEQAVEGAADSSWVSGSTAGQ